MAEMTEAYDWRGRTILDARGERIGRIDQVYLDLETDQPEWALVDRGLFCRGSTFVPVGSARPAGEDVQVQVAKAEVKSAPVMEGYAALSPEEEAELLRHYGVENPEAPPSAAPTGTGATDAVSGGGAMTRSEEELHVRTVSRPRTRVRLRKYVVTEMVTKTVPVRHEEVRLEREPIADTDPPEPMSPEGAHEVVLHEEQLVIEKRVVPTERVRMVKETTVEERTVTDALRKEQIDT
jgi:uncharacterized protein (TIGR02271 family)